MSFSFTVSRGKDIPSLSFNGISSLHGPSIFRSMRLFSLRMDSPSFFLKARKMREKIFKKADLQSTDCSKATLWEKKGMTFFSCFFLQSSVIRIFSPLLQKYPRESVTKTWNEKWGVGWGWRVWRDASCWILRFLFAPWILFC